MNSRIRHPSQLFSPALCLSLFAILVGTRLFAAFFLPVIDPSEARYAEIARKVIELNDWITLYHEYGIPFWAKPPFSTWCSALGMLLFGENEFGVRFPLFLIALLILGLTTSFAKTQPQRDLPLLSGLILFSSALFYVSSALVMTDLPFILGLTLSMVAFWKALHQDRPLLWGYLFFLGQAIGMLGKGLICPVLTGLPLLAWVLLNGKIKETWQRLPWILGTLLMMAIALPWYVLAELKTPGFLNYFIVGEHFSRFLTQGWKGDLYGNAHSWFKGMIWVYWLTSFFPWSLWVLAFLFSKLRTWKTTLFANDWVIYLWLWALSPLIFFTFAGNIIQTYVLPSLPAWSLLLAYFIHQHLSSFRYFKQAFIASVLIGPFLMVGVTLYSFYNPEALNNQKRLIQDFRRESQDACLVYFCSNCYSAPFYSKGDVPLIRHEESLQQLLQQSPLYVAIRARKVNDLPADIREQLTEVGLYGTTLLFKSKEK